MASGQTRLPINVPICYAARKLGLVSLSNQEHAFTVLELTFGNGTTNFSGTAEVGPYVAIHVPVVIRVSSTSCRTALAGHTGLSTRMQHHVDTHHVVSP